MLKRIALSVSISTLMFGITVALIAISINNYETRQFDNYTNIIKNARQKIILYSLLIESEIYDSVSDGVESVVSQTDLSHKDMVIKRNPQEELDIISATARKVMHDVELYLNHAYEKANSYVYFRSYMNDVFILDGFYDDVNAANIGFEMDYCQVHEYCILRAWKGELNDRIFVSKPFDSVISKSKVISLMAPIYFNDEIVAEFGVLLDLSNIFRNKKTLKLSNADGNRNIIIHDAGYPFPEINFTRSFVIDNFNLLVYKTPLSKFLLDYLYLWLAYLVLCFLYFWKSYDAKISKERLGEAIDSSNKDELTGVYNRKVFKDKQFLSRIGTDIYSVVAIDGNRIKKINDRYGHHVGDEAIVVISQSMQKVFRDSDYLIRTGGDEFLAVLPGCNESKAYLLAKKLDKITQDNHLKKLDINISVSFGIAVNDSGEELNDVIERADEALYKMKATRE